MKHPVFNKTVNINLKKSPEKLLYYKQNFSDDSLIKFRRPLKYPPGLLKIPSGRETERPLHR